MKFFKRLVLMAAAVLGMFTSPAPAQSGTGEYEGAAALGLALRRVGVTKRVLMIGAHPDDENTALLSTLALKQGAEVAYLSLTRGEGGQNLLGPELGEPLGLIRTEELLAARRLDGARQFFTRAYEFGYSRTAEETFRHWPRDSILGDVVAAIRRFRPQVMVTIFTGTPRDGHGHHQVAGILAREAFAAAGDSARFPEQIRRGLAPYAPRKLYQARWGRSDEPGLVVSTGEMDPLLGRSHYQIAMASRSRHQSQDMGQALLPGPQSTRVERVSPGGLPDERSIFAGLDTTLAARAQTSRAAAELALFDTHVARLRRGFNALAPGELIPGLADALRILDRAGSLLAGEHGASADELRFLVAAETADLQRALMWAAEIRLDAIAGDDRVVPGQSFPLELVLWNGSTRPVSVAALEPVLPSGWRAEALDSAPSGTVGPGMLLTRRFTVQVPADAAPTEPYFLRGSRVGDMYSWPADADTAGQPFEPPPVRAAAMAAVEGVRIPLRRDASFREVDQAQGEIRRPVLVVPQVSVRVEPAVAVLPVARSGTGTALRHTMRLTTENPGGIAGTLRVQVPPGWRASPAALPLRFGKAGESRAVEVLVYPTAGVAPGDYAVQAVFQAGDGRSFDRGMQLVSYPHVQPHPLYHAAASRVRAFDIRVPTGFRVGYVRGASDRVPEALMQLGLQVELLDADALGLADLDRYSTVVVGSRAYEVRPDLVANNQRLLDYAERGGTVLVQYQQYQFVQGGFAPFRLAVARPHDRVTDESAPVRLLDPTHPALSVPNRITARDFEGWVQERGLYFARDWDARYTPLLETADPSDSPLRGGLLVTRHGRGTYVYTGLAFFRQLPEGVPGAYRLFTNLLALGAKR